MSGNHKESMKKSTSFYERNMHLILPQFKEFSKMYSIELDSKSLAKLFDQYSGIDYVLSYPKKSKLYGIAARVNFWWKMKGKLTIRYKRSSGAKTEYEKRVSSITKNDSFYPHVTMQIDADKEEQFTTGGIICKTDELYIFIEANKEAVFSKYMNTCSEGNDYLGIPFGVIKDEFELTSKVFNIQ